MLARDLLTNIRLRTVEQSKLAFYIKRLTQDTFTRRIGATLIVLALVFQVITFLSPPKPSHAASQSTNDIINGGFTSRDDLVTKCQNNFQNIQAVYGYWGITCADLAVTSDATVTGNQNLWSIGRNPHSAQDIPFTVDGATLYVRPLSTWGVSASYRTLTGVTKKGNLRFWIMYGCGNAVFPSIPYPPPTKPVTPPPVKPTPKPVASFSCLGLAGTPTNGNAPLKVNFTATYQLQNTTLKGFLFNFGDGTTLNSAKAAVSHAYTTPGNYQASVRIETAAGTTAVIAACEKPLVVTAPNLGYLKTADNLTVLTANGQPTNAANTTAQPDNKIRYTLTVINKGNGVYTGFKFQENINDILEYANVVSTGGATQSANGVLTWPVVNIPAHASVIKTFVVQIKNPIPDTPTSVSDPQSFDLHLDNVFFANMVRINVPGPPVKVIETTTQTLPQTGASWMNIILALFAAGATFMFLRSRLLARELAIATRLAGGQ